MARCAYCRTETELYESQVPVCVHCADEDPDTRHRKAALFRDLEEATKRAEAASDAFAAVTNDIPSGMPHPDGVQRIHNASRELSAARDEMIKAHNRLNDFLNTGIVREEMKRRDSL